MQKLVLVACAAAVGCGVDPIDVPETIEKKEPCGEMICGNAAQLGAHEWWELDATGSSYSPTGRVKIVDFRTAGNVVLKPLVQGYRLLGVGPGNVYYGGASLVGSHLSIDSDSGEHFLLTLESVGTAAYVEGGFDPEVSIPTYNWSYIQLGGPSTPMPTPVCEGAKIDLYYKDAIIFTGDRYNGPTATVKAIGNTQPWFNFACRDDVLWKQFLFRYVSVAQGPAVPARNTAIAAIHADYCGTNHPYTVTGTDVDWANRSGSLWIDPGYPNVEAIWGGGRAICLTHPRKVPKLAVDCGGNTRPPDCTPSQITNWVSLGYELITYVP